jgi:hypothetical protein
MNKYSVIGGTSALVGFATTTYLVGSMKATIDRPIFKDLDRKVLKKAYWRMFRRVITGRLDIEGKTEAQLDHELREQYWYIKLH